MSLVQNSLAVFLIVFGLAMMLLGSAGIIRLPDFFTRTHAASMVDTVGIIFLLSGFAVHEGLTLNAAKLVLAMVFVALTNPVGVHILARAAIRFGVKPWRSGASDKGGRT